MIAVAAGLMAPLGWWVSQKANTSTEVALNQIDEIHCPDILSAKAAVAPTPEVAHPDEVEDLLNGDTIADEPTVDPAEEKPVAEGADDDTGDREERRRRPVIKVNIDDSEMPVNEPIGDPDVVVVGDIQERPATPEEIKASVEAHNKCQANVVARKDSVEGRQSLITWVMLVSGGFLLLGLGVYGIKTTHKVAGPLFKVGLYLKKLENNIYDTVYNLRKGDQLVEFYDHFKSAHSAVTTMQEQDRDRLKDALKLANDAGLADKSEELASAVKEIERLLAEKEESLGKKEA